MIQRFFNSGAELARACVNSKTGELGVDRSYISKLDKVGKIVWVELHGKRFIDGYLTAQRSGLIIQYPESEWRFGFDHINDCWEYPLLNEGQIYTGGIMIMVNTLISCMSDFERRLSRSTKEELAEVIRISLEEWFDVVEVVNDQAG